MEGVKSIFSRRVKELMKKERYSQKQLCELCNITEATFSRYMTSERLPKTDMLYIQPVTIYWEQILPMGMTNWKFFWQPARII